MPATMQSVNISLECRVATVAVAVDEAAGTVAKELE
jgi:hypothetical protein